MSNINPFKRTCLYYGTPISIVSSRVVSDAIAKYGAYDIVVLGEDYEHPSDPNYSTTLQICAGLIAQYPTINLVGYIYMPKETATVKAEIDEWKTLGVNGIFLDCFGADYGATRAKLNEIVNYCHTNNFNVIANCWDLDEIFSSAVDSTFNPSGLDPVLNSSDYWCLENLFFTTAYTDEQGREVTPYMQHCIRPYRIEWLDEYQNTIHTGQASSWKQLYGTKLLCLDAIPSNFSDKDWNRVATISLVGSAIMKIDSVAFGDEYWGSRSFYKDWTYPTNLSLYPFDSAPFTKYYSESVSGNGNDNFVNKIQATIDNDVYNIVLNYANSEDVAYTLSKTQALKNNERLLNAWDSSDYTTLKIDIKYNNSVISTVTSVKLVELDTSGKYMDYNLIVDTISGGIDPSDATASANKILDGYTAYIADGTKVAGTIYTYNNEYTEKDRPGPGPTPGKDYVTEEQLTALGFEWEVIE